VSATRFILISEVLRFMVNMRKRLPSKEFLALADILWQGNAKVRFQNPDNWIII
jgi:hypothetical protein